MTSANPEEEIKGVVIKYRVNYSSIRTAYPSGPDGRYTIWANEGDDLTIWAEKDNNYMFDPAFYSFKVTGDRRDADFRVAGWTDDFSNDNSGWVDDPLEKYYVDVPGGGEYEIRVSPPYSISVTAPLAVPRSYTVEATMYTLSGSGMYGLIFNAGNLAAGESYYIFRVHENEGYAEFLKAVKIAGKTETTLLGYKTNDQINQYNTTISSTRPNRLEIVQNVYFAKMFVNGVEVFYEALDMLGSNHVKVGLYACPDDYVSHTARFDDFKMTAMGFSASQLSGAAGFNKSIEISQ